MKLIIAEKPSVARSIAKVVGADKKENGYLAGEDILVSWCLGHLIAPASPEAYDPKLARWSLEALPIIPAQYKTDVTETGKAQFRVLQQLMQRSDVAELIEATDAGREGELIFRLVYEKAGCRKPFKRLWISSLEESSIRAGLAQLQAGENYNDLYAAALCRQRADWLVGINFTRLYTKVYGKKLPCGRVQTPTVAMIVQRQEEIDSFIPQKYFSISADLKAFKAYTQEESRTRALEILQQCSGADAVVTKVNRAEKVSPPPALYDLTTLQRDANRILGYSAKQTAEYAQSLYEKEILTYPRTDSRFITGSQKESTIRLLENIIASKHFDIKTLKCFDGKTLNVEAVINDGKVSDHHALLPTESAIKNSPEELRELPTGEQKILRMVVYRLLEAVASPYEYVTTTATLDIEGYAFTATGREEVSAGWTEIEAIKKEELLGKSDAEEPQSQELPPMSEGNAYMVCNISMAEQKTKPPKAYTEDTLLKAMETAGSSIDDADLRGALKGCGLGTPATRAGIIENIISAGYINRNGKNLYPTDMAKTMVEVVSPKLINAKLTAEWEQELARIQSGKGSSEDFEAKMQHFVRSTVEEKIALHMPEEDSQVFQNVVGTCPCCKQRVIERPKSYSCEAGQTCGFVIWKKLMGKDLTEAQVKKLLQTGKSDIIKGFTSKTGKIFDAQIVLQNGEVRFEFPSRSLNVGRGRR